LGKSKDILRRIASVTALILVSIFCIFFAPIWIYALFVIFFICLGLNEFFNMIKIKGIPVYKYLGLFLGLIIPIAIYGGFKPTGEWTLFLLLLAFIIFFVLQFFKKKPDNVVLSISTTVFGVIYVSWLGSYMLKIRFLDKGSLLVLFLLLVVKLGDAGAYFFGKTFGRHKLLERVSPKKSIEGALGGLMTSVVVSLLGKLYLTEIPLFHFLILGILAGVAAQLGDLSESLIKRDCNVKDSGRFIPQQGGVLDLIDSILFSAPIIYLYVIIYNLPLTIR
jgi:phosphatidate cytidylyltransferase